MTGGTITMGTDDLTKHDHILAGLVFSLQAAAMQQLGKIQNPMTGEVEKDLEQARGTIDILEMLKAKCRTDTPPDLLRLLDGAVMDLQLNYMDEIKKKPAAAETAAAEEETQETGETEAPAADGADA
jgi:hypothetical protein